MSESSGTSCYVWLKHYFPHITMPVVQIPQKHPPTHTHTHQQEGGGAGMLAGGKEKEEEGGGVFLGVEL